MHGQIHDSLKMMILELFGDQVWEKVLKKAEAKESEDFLKYRHYSDSHTIHLIKATSEVLELPLEDTLRAYGDYFCKYAMNLGYDRLIRSLGYDFISFLENLDTVHTLLAVSYHDIIPPIFRAEKVDENTVNLHYYSIRLGLEMIVVGLLEAVARDLYDCLVETKVLSTELYYTENWKVQNHAIIEMKVIRRGMKLKISSLNGDVNRVPTDVTHKTDSHDLLREESESLSDSDYMSSPKGAQDLKCPSIPAHQFRDIFPFHIVFDSDLIIKQVGSGLAALCSSIRPGKCFRHVCDVMHPRMPFTYEEMRNFHKATFVFGVKNFQGKGSALPLKGQLMAVNDYHMIFLCSPKLRTLDEMEQTDIYICDFPIFDTSREFMQLNQLRQAEVNISSKLEETTTALEIMARDLEKEKAKTDLLLHQMLPPKVANQLREGKPVEAEKYEEVTILFSDIVTFTNISAVVTPMDVVSMLNMLFSQFDELASLHNVYKVETIGDAYMVASGVPEVNSEHARVTLDMALDMILASLTVTSPATGKPLQIRVGVHSGAVVAGVVGNIMPRYCLFGDTVNTASRMESHGAPGVVHISPTTYKAVEGKGYNIIKRGEIEVKGKGLMTTYFVLGTPRNPDIIKVTEKLKNYICVKDENNDIDLAGDKETTGLDNHDLDKNNHNNKHKLENNDIGNNSSHSSITRNGLPDNKTGSPRQSRDTEQTEISVDKDVNNVQLKIEASQGKDKVTDIWKKNGTVKSQYCTII